MFRSVRKSGPTATSRRSGRPSRNWLSGLGKSFETRRHQKRASQAVRIFEQLECRALLATFTVTNLNDTGAGSFRQALTDANAGANADLITFSIPGSAPHVIQPESPLPIIEATVTIDGWSEPDFVSTPVIVLNGELAGNTVGLDIQANTVIVRGLVIQGFERDGIRFSESNNSVIQGNYIGTTADGMSAFANGHDGIRFDAGSHDNLIGTDADGTRDVLERNIISGNESDGIDFRGADSINNVIQGNYIGTNATGLIAIPNLSDGIEFNRSGVNYVGGNLPGQGNVISGNGANGIQVWRTAHDQIIQGNLIGVGADGVTPLGNGRDGVDIQAGSLQGEPPVVLYVIDVSGSTHFAFAGTPVGDVNSDGTADTVLDAELAGFIEFSEALAAQGTNNPVAISIVVFAGTAAAVDMSSAANVQLSIPVNSDTDNNGILDVVEVLKTIVPGYLGTGSSTSFPNALDEAVTVFSSLQTTGDAGNMVFVSDGHNNGGDFSAPLNTLVTMGINRVAIGMGSNSELTELQQIDPNAVQVTSSNAFTTQLLSLLGINNTGGGPGTNVLIGGTQGGAGNVIAFNNVQGVDISTNSSTGNSILGNSIHSNGGLGIDIGPDGVTPNDVDDADSGANNLVNHPTLRSISTSVHSASVYGDIQGAANETYRVEFFQSDQSDSSGYGEGRTYLGAVNATANALGVAPFVAVWSRTFGPGWITATATDSSGNTSEFSRVTLIAGEDPYADSVLEYDPLHFGGPAPTQLNASDPWAAVDAPDFPPNGLSASDGRVALGNGGRIHLQFVNNRLLNTGNATHDLQIYEAGADVEKTFVAIRPTAETLSLLTAASDPDGNGFYDVGFVGGGRTSIDIDAAFPGFAPGVLRFDAVQLIDDPQQGATTGATVGADIDAIVALASISVPPGYAVINSGPNTIVRESGTTDSFEVRLDVPPGSNVVITVTPVDPTEVSVDKTVLTFTPAEWNIPQVVTVSGVDDSIDDGNQVSFISLSVNDAQSDNKFAPLPDRIVGVVTLDDDAVGFSLTRATALVSETGTTDHFDVVLTSEPFSNVVIDVTSDNSEVSLSATTLTFTPLNWFDAQSVTMTGVDDQIVDGDQVTSVTLSINDPASDDTFDALADQSVIVTTTDDDSAAFTVTQTDGITTVSETKTTDTFTVVLTTQPQTSVVIDLTLDHNTDITLDKSTLTFTPSDWNTVQTVTAAGVDDVFVDGDKNTIVTLSVNDGVSDDVYDSLADQSLVITTTDDDEAGFILNKSAVSVSESGSQTFTVLLTSAPLTDVVLTVRSSDTGEATVSPETLTITSTNWINVQTVTISGVADGVLDGDQSSTVTLTIDDDNSDDQFDALANQTITVTTTDSDLAGFDVIETGGSTIVSESGTTDSFTVALTARPESNVVIAVTSADNGEVIVNRNRLIFTPSNWNLRQNVTVTGTDDSLLDGDQTTLIRLSIDDVRSSDSFDPLPDQFVSVMTTNDDVAGFTVSHSTAVVSESGTTDSFSVVLTAAPASNVILHVVSDDTGEAIVSAGTLTFDPFNWKIPRPITVTGIDDALNDGDQTTAITISVDAALSNNAFDSVPEQVVTVTTIDDERPVVTGPVGASSQMRPTITWNEVADAASYELWLELIGGSSNPVVNPTVSGTSYTLTTDLGVGRFRPWVRSILSNGSKSEWGIGAFQINAAPVLHPLPFHGDDPTPTISWDPVAGAVAYRVYILNTTGNSVVTQDVNGTSFTPATELGFGKHRIWVRALGAGNYAAAWSAAKDYYLGPELVTPLVSTFDAQPTFTWTSLPNIASFQLYVARGGTVVFNETGLTETSFEPPSELQFGRHLWWIRPTHTSGKVGVWSPSGAFFVGGQPQIISPVGTINDSTPTIEWGSVDGAGSFEIYLFNDDGAGLIHRESGLTGTAYQSFPLDDGDYRVWVKSYQANGDSGLWSRPQNFTVDAATVSTLATPVSPVTPTFDSTPTFQWTAAVDAASFDLFLSNGEKTIEQADLVGTSWTPASPLAAGPWQWWVRAKNASGAAGPWNTANTDTSGRVVLFSPSGNTSDRTPTITWSHVNGARGALMDDCANRRHRLFWQLRFTFLTEVAR